MKAKLIQAGGFILFMLTLLAGLILFSLGLDLFTEWTQGSKMQGLMNYATSPFVWIGLAVVFGLMFRPK